MILDQLELLVSMDCLDLTARKVTEDTQVNLVLKVNPEMFQKRDRREKLVHQVYKCK